MTDSPQPDATARLLDRLRTADRWLAQSVASRRTRRLLVFGLIGFTLLILAWSVYRNWDTLLSFDWQFQPYNLALSFLFFSVAMYLSVRTWHAIMVRLAGFRDLAANIRLYLYSAFARRMPGFVWYVGSRLYLYQQAGIPKTVTSVAFFLESVMTVLSGMLVFLGSMAFSGRDWLAGKWPWLLLAMVPLLILVVQPSLLIRFLNAILRRLGRPTLELDVRRRDSVYWIVLYAGNWLAGGLTLYFLASAIHPLPGTAIADVVGLVALTGVLRWAVFFIPGAWGLQELSLSLSLSPYLPLPLALGIPLLFRLWLIVGELVWIAGAGLVLR